MNYIIIYLEIEHLLNFLTQEEKGDFLDLLISYGKNQKLPAIENKKILNVFNFVKGRLDTQFEKAKIKAETARLNGASGGRPKKPSSNPKEPKKTQLVRDKDFDLFWNEYDYKKAKGAAEKSFKAAIKKAKLDEILEGVKKYKASRGDNSQYWKHPSTWLNQECWFDEEINSNSRGSNLSDLVSFVNKIGKDTLVKEITLSDSNKPVFHFSSRDTHNKLMELSDSDKGLIKKELNRLFGSEQFERIY